jgi:hypothetical protein
MHSFARRFDALDIARHDGLAADAELDRLEAKLAAAWISVHASENVALLAWQAAKPGREAVANTQQAVNSTG